MHFHCSDILCALPWVILSISFEVSKLKNKMPSSFYLQFLLAPKYLHSKMSKWRKQYFIVAMLFVIRSAMYWTWLMPKNYHQSPEKRRGKERKTGILKAAPPWKYMARYCKARTTDDRKHIADRMREKNKAHGMMNEISSGTKEAEFFMDLFLPSVMPFC